MDEILECVADHAFLDAEARRAYGILQSDGWKPDGTEGAGLGKTTTFSRKQYHNALYELACKKRRFSRPVVGEAVATLLSQGKDELWNALWLDTKRFLQELDGAVESMSKRENKPMEAYMDPDQYKKAHLTPKTVSPGYSNCASFSIREGVAVEMSVPMNIVVMVKVGQEEDQLSQRTAKKLETRMGTLVTLLRKKAQWMRHSRSGRI